MDETTSQNNLNPQGAERMEVIRQEKVAIIMDLFKTTDTIEREDVMAALDCSKSSASHHLLMLVGEGKIVQQGQSGPASCYTKA